MPKVKSKLPPLYHTFFPDFFEKDFPEEKWATCSNCTLCRSSKSPYLDTKCCNYYPYLANYLIGGILSDPRPEMAEGQKRVRELIYKKAGITPYGIIPPVGYHASGKPKSEDTPARIETREEYNAKQCPYLNVKEGACTIWDYRENLCSTHFCLSSGGEIGEDFWKKTNKYLQMAENVLSNYALHQLGVRVSKIKTDPIQKIKFGLEKENGEINDDAYTKLWEKWAGREEELYIRCYEIITALDEQKFVELCGHKQVILAEGMQELLNSFNNNVIPERLILHPELVVQNQDENEYTLSLMDHSIKISHVHYLFIKRFDGSRNTKSIIDEAFLLMINLGSILGELFGKGMLVPTVQYQEAV
jgi:Fe-S-cluster containining protein